MKRMELEHIIRAAGSIVGDKEIIVVGSQSVLGQFPDAPDELLRSIEADIFPKNRPELADLIDGSIGELSPFHATFGYYAHGVGEKTAALPDGWEQRLIPIENENTGGITGWCLETHDLVISKYVAGRKVDLEFNAIVVANGMVDRDILLSRVDALDASSERKKLVSQKINSDFSRVSIGQGRETVRGNRTLFVPR